MGKERRTMINVIGNFFGSSGYAVHTRSLANSLAKLEKVRVTTNLMPGWESMCNDLELLMIKQQPEKDEINLIIDLPFRWKLFTGNGRNWAYCVWEGDRVPVSFIEEFLNPEIEYILVPSVHTAKAIEKTVEVLDEMDIVLDKVKVIPHGYDPQIFKPQKKEGVFTFLANKGFRNTEDRGGIQYLIQAYIEEFTSSDQVELFLKINPAYGLIDIGQYVKSLSNRTDLPMIRVNADMLPAEMMNEIYNKGDVFVSPTRADAFNIPCLEALACGLPVITTNFGGQTDFVNERNGWIISGELKKVEHELMYEEISWLTPDIKELRKAMREAYSNKELLNAKKFLAPQSVSEMTWDNTAKLLITLK